MGDLDDLPEKSQREEWMSMEHDALAGAFKKAQKFEVRRSAEDEEKFEKMYKDRGASLLERKAKGDFAAHDGDIEKAGKRSRAVDPTQDLWGASADEQSRGV